MLIIVIFQVLMAKDPARAGDLSVLTFAEAAVTVSVTSFSDPYYRKFFTLVTHYHAL